MTPGARVCRETQLFLEGESALGNREEEWDFFSLTRMKLESTGNLTVTWQVLKGREHCKATFIGLSLKVFAWVLSPMPLAMLLFRSRMLDMNIILGVFPWVIKTTPMNSYQNVLIKLLSLTIRNFMMNIIVTVNGQRIQQHYNYNWKQKTYRNNFTSHYQILKVLWWNKLNCLYWSSIIYRNYCAIQKYVFSHLN